MTDNTRLTNQELQGFIDYFERLKAADEKDLLPLRIAKQLLATMQREAKLREALDALMNTTIWSLEDFVYDVRERADMHGFEGSSWDHPDVVAYSEAIDKAKEALASCE